MLKITVDLHIAHPSSTVKVSDSIKVIKTYVPKCPVQGVRVEGKDFVLNITPLKSAVGRQEWFVEFVNIGCKWWEPKERIAFIYDVRKGNIAFCERWKRS